MQAKLEVRVNGKIYRMESEGDDLFDLLKLCRQAITQKIILGTYRRHLRVARNKSDAVMETALKLGISERSVWRVVINN